MYQLEKVGFLCFNLLEMQKILVASLANSIVRTDNKVQFSSKNYIFTNSYINWKPLIPMQCSHSIPLNSSQNNHSVKKVAEELPEKVEGVYLLIIISYSKVLIHVIPLIQ